MAALFQIQFILKMDYIPRGKKKKKKTWLQERTIVCGYEPLAILSSSQTHPGSLTLVNTFPPLLSYDPCLQIQFSSGLPISAGSF